ncbi:MAG TPA: replication-relaxation family protein [Candidatus Acidoferrales bacterium]|nr:replication-relaxation family protein [Candidatus Acidoferrales bacterium]
MRLTNRCIELLKLLRSARWLTTGQVCRRFFAPASVSAARRRLRALTCAGYLRKHQENRMREAVFALGRKGKIALERDGFDGVALERKPPKQREHMEGVNDIRIAAEMTDGLAFFFAAWELPGIGWKFPMVPDAVFRVGDRTFAAEYDRGREGLRYFVGSKVAWYRRGISGFPLSGVLVVADRDARMRTLARAIDDRDGRVLCTTINAIRREGLPESLRRNAAPAATACSPEGSRRENTFVATTVVESTACENLGTGS